MAYDEQLEARVRSVFDQRKVAFEEKRMIGGLCFLVDDKMCVGVEKERLMVRLDPEIYEQWAKSSKKRTLHPATKTKSREIKS